MDHTSKVVPDRERQKQAIANAFRVACLAVHGKPLKHLAMHYQDIMHIPHSVSDPKVYSDALESARIRHNRHEGVPNPEIIHKPHVQALDDFYAYYHAHHPHMTPYEAKDHADREVRNMQYEIEQRMARDKPDKDIEEHAVLKELNRHLKMFVKQTKRMAATAEHPDSLMYPGFHQTSLQGIGHSHKYLDEFLDSALKDKKENYGHGHLFRDAVLKKGLPHVGPKEASLAWNLLAPNTSQLATLDATTLDALGYKTKDMLPRDYEKYERQLATGRDASGYYFLPLGQFQKGLLDAYQGPTDHQTLKPWNPTPHHQVNWEPGTSPQVWPDWWEATKPDREAAGNDWDTNIAPHTPQNIQPLSSIQDPNKDYFYTVDIPQHVQRSIGGWVESITPRDPQAATSPDYANKLGFSQEFNIEGARIGAPYLVKERTYGVEIVAPILDQVPNGLTKVIRLGTLYEQYLDDEVRALDITAIKPPPIQWYISSFRVTEAEPIENGLRHIYYPGVYIGEALARQATVGPNVDNSINDPLANNATAPQASPQWIEKDRNCDYCHGSKIITINGKKMTCPHCNSWHHAPITDPSSTDPATDNPLPGELNPGIALGGP